MDLKVRNITLIITRWCNLNCTYCYEAYKNEEMMSLDLASKIVSNELYIAEEQKYDVFHVTFMGGEPFSNFFVIRRIVEWLTTQETRVRIEASAATNGTLITEEMKEWLEAHKSFFKVQISYDGGVSQQIANRTGQTIDLDFFLRTYPMQGVHITVSQATLPRLSQSVLNLVSKNARCSTNLARGTDWSMTDADVYLTELRVLSKYYLTLGLCKEPIPILTNSLELIGSSVLNRMPCGNVAYDVDGQVYPCHLFTPIVVGNGRAIHMTEFKRDCTMSQFGGLNDPYCSDCPLCNWCPTCYGFNYLLTGNTGTRDHSICKMMFAQALAASEYQIQYFRRAGVSEENAKKVKAAIQTYRILKTNTVGTVL